MGQTINYELPSFSDPENDSVTLAVSSKPSFVEYDANSKCFTIKPGASTLT